MLHKPVRSALHSFQHVKAGGFEKDHLLTVNIQRNKGTILFVSNLFNHEAAEGKQQQI